MNKPPESASLSDFVSSPRLGISLMPEDDFRNATSLLFEEGLIDVLEWSFDVHWGDRGQIPSWCRQLLAAYSKTGSLLGHGVTFSPFSGRVSLNQEEWLDKLRTECNTIEYLQISEHFGFMEAGAFIEGAPMPVPMTAESVEIGRRSLFALSEASHLPVGLENLALAFGLEDVKKQGQFLHQVLSQVDGFLLMDLHNLFCQVVNFGVDPEELLRSYPLELVREIHISGGSYSVSSEKAGRRIRRDTHDDAVPEEVFAILESTLPLFENLEFVILERLGNTMKAESSRESFREDFLRLREVVRGQGH